MAKKYSAPLIPYSFINEFKTGMNKQIPISIQKDYMIEDSPIKTFQMNFEFQHLLR